ncbi:hypothetical protein ACFPM0_07325 [Pseudonocardia sulfidoxydans]|uniref:hypothetical protein n=1 Tax=Pseudonocardia sulfidoxydans TaxID=54011 RepID=UPI003622A5AC
MQHPTSRHGRVVPRGRFARSCRAAGHCALIAGSHPGGTGAPPARVRGHSRDEEGSP